MQKELVPTPGSVDLVIQNNWIPELDQGQGQPQTGRAGENALPIVIGRDGGLDAVALGPRWGGAIND
jgi:hypothetical protein